MRIGVFTPLLSQLPLPEVLKKLKTNGIGTVELGTGNYPGDAHCKLSMLDDAAALAELERRYIELILRETGGNKKRAAEILGIDRRTLYRTLEREGRAAEAEDED